MLGPLKYSHVKINFNKPLVDVSIWVVNNELVMIGPPQVKSCQNQL